MILNWLDWSLVAGYLLLSLAIGLWYTKAASGSLTQFFLGGRNLPWWLAGLSMVATTFAADTPLAVAELVGKFGVSGNWMWWNMVVSGMLTTFFFAQLWRRANILTEVEFVEFRYGGRPAAFLRAFRSVYLGLFMNCCIIAWVNVAMRNILKVFFGLDDWQALAWTGAAMALTSAYSSLAGIRGVAVTDMVQFIIAMTGCVVLAVFVVGSPQIGGIEGLESKLPAGALEFFPKIGSAGDAAATLTVGVGTFLAWTLVQWWSSWYPGAEPGGGGFIAQRMMSTRSDKEALYSTLLFQIAHYCVRPWPWILVGLSALVLYPDLAADDKQMGFIHAMRDFLPAGFRGLLLVAFLAAYMSTISTQLNWGASYLVNDLYARFVAPGASDRHLVLASRLATILLMIVGLAVTTQVQSISNVWKFVMECGAGLGLVLILRWYWWRINAWSEIVATLAPFLAFGYCKGAGIDYPASFFLTVGFTTAAWLAATFATHPEPTERLVEFYRRVRPGGLWRPISALAPDVPIENMRPRFVAWIAAAVLAYASLFCIGKVIFRDWIWSGIYGGAAVVCAIIVQRAVFRIVSDGEEKRPPG